MTTYKFDQKFVSYDMEQLLADLFNDPIVLAGETEASKHFKLFSRCSRWGRP